MTPGHTPSLCMCLLHTLLVSMTPSAVKLPDSGMNCHLRFYHLPPSPSLRELVTKTQTLHAGLAQCNLPDSIFDKHLRFLRTGKISLLGGWGKVLSAALNVTVTCCWLPKKNCRVRMGTFLRETKETPTRAPTASTIVISTHAPPFSLSWHKIQKWMEANLIDWATSHCYHKVASVN